MPNDIGSLEFADLRAFFLVAETGSFTRAAHRMEAAKSIVSRRVARLEEALSARLLQRTPTGTVLTEEGQLYYDQAFAAMQQLDSAAEALSSSVQEVAGPIRMTVPVYFGPTMLSPLFAQFMTLYPGVELDIQTTEDTRLDVAREGLDLVVRTGHLVDSALIARPLCHSRRNLVASPDYLKTAPPIETPEDLIGHRILHYSGLYPQELWRYHIGDQIVQLRLTPFLRSNSASVLMAAVTAGQGLTVLPSYATDSAVAAGQAVEVLPDVNWGTTQVTILTPGRKLTRRVRVLIDFLLAHFSSRVV